jgi:hypothetical protein
MQIFVNWILTSPLRRNWTHVGPVMLTSGHPKDFVSDINIVWSDRCQKNMYVYYSNVCPSEFFVNKNTGFIAVHFGTGIHFKFCLKNFPYKRIGRRNPLFKLHKIWITIDWILRIGARRTKHWYMAWSTGVIFFIYSFFGSHWTMVHPWNFPFHFSFLN